MAFTRLLLSLLLKLSKLIDNSFRFDFPSAIFSMKSLVCNSPRLTALRVTFLMPGMVRTEANMEGFRSTMAGASEIVSSCSLDSGVERALKKLSH